MNPVLHLGWVWGGRALLAFCILAALLRGGAPEKWGAAILFLSWISTPLLDDHQPFTWAIFWADIAAFVALAVLAIVSRRLWAMVAAACQAVCVAVHIMVLMGPMIKTWAYYTATGLWGGTAPLVALAVGILALKRPRHAPDAAARSTRQ